MKEKVKWQCKEKGPSKTGFVRDVEIDYSNDPLARIKIVVTKTTGGAQTSSGYYNATIQS